MAGTLNPTAFRVPANGGFRIADSPTQPAAAVDKKTAKRHLKSCVREIAALQEKLYAENSRSLLLIFQAMDAGGKDSTIRAVSRGVNPAGFQVFSFKQPSNEELDHDFLWRTTCRLPERGRIGIFNRSYYEEVLVVHVHPEYLTKQRLPPVPSGEPFWQARYASIREHEAHLVRNGTTVLKFWLNVSRDEQARRLLDRIDSEQKNWKFDAHDIDQREHWDDYMAAYEAMLNATSTELAPWYAIPADNKPFMRLLVATIIRDTLRGLDPRYPRLPDSARDDLAAARELLRSQAG